MDLSFMKTFVDVAGTAVFIYEDLTVMVIVLMLNHLTHENNSTLSTKSFFWTIYKGSVKGEFLIFEGKNVEKKRGKILQTEVSR